MKSALIRVSGIVQGVGFRPFIFRKAKELNLCGFVKNLGDAGVEIRAEGSEEDILALVDAVKKNPFSLIYPTTWKPVYFALRNYFIDKLILTSSIEFRGKKLPLNTQSKTKITVGILAYNYGRFLDCCLDSVMHQTRPPDEIVLIDDCSTDNTYSLVKQYQKKIPIRYFRHKKNLGQVTTYNHALAEAKGDYIFLLSADDYLAPEILAKEAAVLDAYPQVGLVYSQSYTKKNGKSMLIVAKPAGSKSYIGRKNDFARLLIQGDFLPVNTILVRNKVYRQIGLYDPKVIYRTDTEMKIRIAKHYPLAYLAEPLAYYRIHQNNMHLTKIYQKNYESEFKYILDKHLPQDKEQNSVNLRKQAFFNHYINLTNNEIELGNYQQAKKYWYQAVRLNPVSLLTLSIWKPVYFTLRNCLKLWLR